MQATGLGNGRLVQARGRHFTVSTLVPTRVWWSGNAFALPLATLSLFAIVPALIGLMIGRRVRARMAGGEVPALAVCRAAAARPAPGWQNLV